MHARELLIASIRRGPEVGPTVGAQPMVEVLAKRQLAAVNRCAAVYVGNPFRQRGLGLLARADRLSPLPSLAGHRVRSKVNTGRVRNTALALPLPNRALHDVSRIARTG